MSAENKHVVRLFAERIGKKIFYALAVLIVLSPLFAAGPVEAGGGITLHARLSGANEAPGPGAPFGRGRATITLGHGEVCFVLHVAHIKLPATAAHIHVGPASVAGPVVVALKAPDANGGSHGCVTADGALIAAIANNPSNYYVNVHNSDFPAGAVRGQLFP